MTLFRNKPTDLGKALAAAKAMVDAGIMFVPMPICNTDELKKRTDEAALQFKKMLDEEDNNQPTQPEAATQ